MASSSAAILKVGLDGEAEYKRALKEIENGLKVLGSEMNLVSAQFDDNADSVEALAAKNDVLDRTILSQEEKIETLRAGLQNAATYFKETDARTMKWRASLNEAEAELIKMKSGLDQNTTAMEKMRSPLDRVKAALSKTKEEGGGVRGAFANLREEFTAGESASSGLGDALESIAGKFGIEIPDGAKKAISGMNGVSAASAGIATAAVAAVAAIVKIERALISMTNESAAAAKELRTLSSVTGQSTEALQEFEYAGDLIGVSGDRIKDSLKEITNKMQDALNGSEDTASAFETLGVNIQESDGSMRSATDVFYDVIDALGEVQNRTERDALAMDLMSESAQELNPLIDAGSEKLSQYAQEAHDLGYVLDDEAVEALNNTDNAYKRLQATQEGIKKQMSAQFAPYLEEFYTKATKFVKTLGETLERSGIVDAFGMLLETIGDIIAPADTLSSTTIPSLTVALRPLAQIMATIADLADVVAGLLTLDFGRVGKGLGFGYSYGNGNNAQTLRESWEQKDINAATTANGYGQYYANGKWYSNYDSYLREEWEKSGAGGTFEYWKMANGYNAAGIDNWRGGRTLLSEAGAEMAILPQGTRILTAQESRDATGGDTYYVTIEARTIKEFEDITRMARDKRRTTRMGVVT